MVKRQWPKPRMKIAASSVFLITGILLICHLIWAAGSILPITSGNVIAETMRSTQVTGSLWETYTASGGGLLGAVLYAMFHVLFDTAGTWIVAFILLSIGAIILTGKTAAPYIAEKVPSLRPALESAVARLKPSKPKQNACRHRARKSSLSK
ncbi:hypothetical protein FK545_00055 [Planococcus glaciei]|nr:hypothetical protein [Planococcus glaciei]QDY44516.1 hypothetical protein FK545_00055 [Planococcus glaciei]